MLSASIIHLKYTYNTRTSEPGLKGDSDISHLLLFDFFIFILCSELSIAASYCEKQVIVAEKYTQIVEVQLPNSHM